MASPTTTPIVSIEGGLITLHSLGSKHATAAYASWLNDPVVNKYLETRSVTMQELKDYIEEKNASENALLLGIFWKQNGEHIGNVKLEPIDRQKKTAVMGILIGEKDYWGKGVATEATNLIAQYAFSKLGMQEITLGVIAENIPAIRVYEKCGFEVYDMQKNAMNHDGVLHDKVCMRKCSSAL